MTIEPTMLTKYRYVKQWGIISRQRDKYVFKAFPGTEFPVLNMENRSRWALVDNIFELMNEYK
jgi:hypothetical protein